MPAPIIIGIKIAPAAAAVPAALGSAMFTAKVANTTPGIIKKCTLVNPLARKLIKCLSQPVKRITKAKPMLEHAEEIILLPMPLAKEFRAAIGLPAQAHITIPAATSTILAS